MVQSKSAAVLNLYNNYSAKLLGYIYEVVQNKLVAEQYLAAVFNDVPNELEEFSKNGTSALCRLQIMARKKLVHFFEALENDTDKRAWENLPRINNRYVALMTPFQQQVFCGIHYQCKSAGNIATELNKTEEEIRKTLKECFTIIRSGRNNERVH
ncbi:hypothetical protein ACEN9X_04195 [Mucilaginibacter sp. Mucisp86]|uniref:hypothetical protein n=1 Tax=Mucilaginibacter sp. Mucisp86 TaxID=3243060 RepID=UPI0039B633C1